MNSAAQELITIVRAAVLGDALPEGFAIRDAGALFRLAKMQDLGHLLFVPEGTADLFSAAERAELEKERLRAIYRTSRLAHAEGEICALLSAEGIRYMPLKGALIRAYYPEPFMRTSCDLDLLVHEEDIECAVALIRDRLGLSAPPERTYHDVSLYLSEDLHIELHFSLLENREPMDRVLARAWEHAAPIEGVPCRYRPANEFLLFHHIAHTAYHLTAGGCGIRPFLDLFILRQRLAYDPALLDLLLAEGGLLTFAAEASRLAAVWFSAAEHSELSRRMADCVLTAGLYGSLENRIAVARAQKSRLAYLLSRIFLPYRVLKEYYPPLKRHKLLYPFFTVRRWAEVLLSPARRGRAARELARSATPADPGEAPAALCRDLGLI